MIQPKYNEYRNIKSRLSSQKLYNHENHDLAFARSSSSHADPGLRVAFKCLNV